jgi:uncharacterized protein YdeI (YjbR/CyaY-like superfamily)
MTKSKTNPKVDNFFKKNPEWPQELAALRTIVRDLPLTEELKWGKPCYSYEQGNVVLFIPLKDTCALMFCKGALLKDAENILTKVGENTQGSRWIKFTNVRQIVKLKNTLKAYQLEAIEAEKSGLKVKYKATSDYAVPAELQNKWDESPAFKKAFAALTPGRQRGYLLYFSAAKQSKTRAARIEKCLPQILNGKGLNDE